MRPAPARATSTWTPPTVLVSTPFIGAVNESAIVSFILLRNCGWHFQFSVSPIRPHVYAFATHMPRHRGDDGGACLRRRRADCRNLERRVEREQLEHVVMRRPRRWSSGAAIVRARRADLPAAVRQRGALRHTFRKLPRRAWDVPHQPVQHVVGPVPDWRVEIVDDEHEARDVLGWTGRRPGPRKRRRDVVSRLSEFVGDRSAVRPCRRRNCERLRTTAAAALRWRRGREEREYGTKNLHRAPI